MPSSRAAILTPSPIRSPSLSSTTSPRWMPMRNSMRRSGGDPGVALDHGPLDFNGAVHRVDDAAELDEAAVAGALDDAPVMHGDGGIDQVASEPPQPRKGAILVRPGKPAVADDIRRPRSRRVCGSRPWRTLWASLRIARKPAHSGVYSCLTCAPASIATNSACASAISGISGVGAKPSRAGARRACASAGRPVDW